MFAVAWTQKALGQLRTARRTLQTSTRCRRCTTTWPPCATRVCRWSRTLQRKHVMLALRGACAGGSAACRYHVSVFVHKHHLRHICCCTRVCVCVCVNPVGRSSSASAMGPSRQWRWQGPSQMPGSGLPAAWPPRRDFARRDSLSVSECVESVAFKRQRRRDDCCPAWSNFVVVWAASILRVQQICPVVVTGASEEHFKLGRPERCLLGGSCFPGGGSERSMHEVWFDEAGTIAHVGNRHLPLVFRRVRLLSQARHGRYLCFGGDTTRRAPRWGAASRCGASLSRASIQDYLLFCITHG